MPPITKENRAHPLMSKYKLRLSAGVASSESVLLILLMKELADTFKLCSVAALIFFVTNSEMSLICHKSSATVASCNFLVLISQAI